MFLLVLACALDFRDSERLRGRGEDESGPCVMRRPRVGLDVDAAAAAAAG